MASGYANQRELFNTDNVARYCPKRRLDENGIPLEEAFRLRESESYLSANWAEYFHPSNRQFQINGVLQSLRAKMNVDDRASIALLNVGLAISACKSQLNLDLRFAVLGQRHDPSHAGIYGCNAKTALVLAKSVRPSEVYPII